MTQSQGGMREIYPEAGEVYRYRIEDRESQFTFNLEGDVAADLKPPITLGVEFRETGEGLCRTESGHIHPFAWAWVGPGVAPVAERRSVRVPAGGPFDKLREAWRCCRHPGARRCSGPHARRGVGGAGR